MFFMGAARSDTSMQHAAGRKKVHPTLAYHDTRRLGGGFSVTRPALYGQQSLDAVRHFADSGHSQRLHPTHHDVHGAPAAHFYFGFVYARYQRLAAIFRGLVITVIRGEQLRVGIPWLVHH